MKDSPTPPDYTGAAQATADASKEATTAQTYANRPTINTPWGSQTWGTSTSTDPATGQGVTQWTSDISLSPQQQHALDSQMGIQQGRSDAANTLLDQATGAFQTPMDWSAAPARSGQISAAQLGTGAPEMGQLSSLNSSAGGVQKVDPFQFGDVNTSIADSGDVQRGLAGDSNSYRQTAQDAVWNLQKPMLDERRVSTENQLANMGLARGSEAWDREMRGVGDAEARAQLQAIDSGRAESAQAFGQDLSAGQFANSAQGQQFGQNYTAAQFGNSGQSQAFGQANQAAATNNAAQGQEFAQDTAQTGFNNAVQQQQYQAAMEAAKMGDSRALQQMEAQMAAGGFNNNNRAASLAEMMQQRGQPLNELNALLTGQQVNMPNMPGFNTAGKAQSVDYTGVANDQYNAAIGDQNYQTSQINSLLGGASQLGSMAFMFSDARLKCEITPMGVLSTGVRVVHYRYRGLPGLHVGVIAQELQQVQPEAVAMHPSGYLMVDYSKVRA